MNITLTGNLGSGKSSVCKILKENGMDIISGGDIFRGVAKEKGISVLEMNELAKKDRSIDDLIDARSTRLGDELNDCVFDSRLAWHFVRESFKVFLTVDPQAAADRVYSGAARAAEDYTSAADAASQLEKRAMAEAERFKTLYDIDYYAASNYDLVIDSTCASPEDIAGIILEKYKEYKEKPWDSTLMLLGIRRFFPSVPFSSFDMEKYESCLKNLETEKGVCLMEKTGFCMDKGRLVITSGAEMLFAGISAGRKLVSCEHAGNAGIAGADDIEKYEKLCNIRYSYYEPSELKYFLYV